MPYTRGPEYSRPFSDIISEAKQLINNSSKEITLLGQNVNAYYYQEQNKHFKLSDIIYELNNLKNLIRIRYTTSHPKDVTEDLINIMFSIHRIKNFCRSTLNRQMKDWH